MRKGETALHCWPHSQQTKVKSTNLIYGIAVDAAVGKSAEQILKGSKACIYAIHNIGTKQSVVAKLL